MRSKNIENRLRALEGVTHPPVLILVYENITKEAARAEFEHINGPIIGDKITYIMIEYEDLPADNCHITNGNTAEH